MEQKGNILRLAVAACFGVAAGQAGAAILGTSNTTWALEINSNSTIVQANTELQIVLNSIATLVPNHNVTPMFVKVSLLNGAFWGSTAPGILCQANSGGSATLVTGSIDFGGVQGGSTVTFRVTGGLAGGTAASMTGVCTVSATSITVSGLTTKTVSAEVSYTNGGVIATTAQVGNYITFARALSTVVSAPTVAVVVDATSGSDNWAAGSNLTVGTAEIGHVTYSYNGTTGLNSAGLTIDASSALNTAVLTVSGPGIAASMAQGVTGMYLSTVSGCGATVLTGAFTNSASITSVTFAGLTAGDVSAGVFICAVVPGNVVITTGQLTATLTGTPSSATRTLDMTAPSNNIANLTANGTTRNAYFVNASTSTAKTSVLRIINRSGISGVLTATAYNEAGTLIGTANSALGTLFANQMMTKTSADIETALGFTPVSATAKYSVVISGALPSMEVLNFSKDANGTITLSNTSTTTTQ